ncbi:hypothetical protein BS17DRAFT_789974 [Gyrodon lividus]|nr:hypothetical protein BS17DRAFT_789974 [Gyrodon lividus]
MFSTLFDAVIQIILQLTPYQALRSSEDVLRMLNDRRGWVIDAYRSCSNTNLPRYNTFATLCTLVFLTMAETLHLRYGRLSPAQLRRRMDAIGYETFAIMSAIPELGVMIVRIVEIFAVSESPVVAASLTLVTALPVIALPVFLHSVEAVSAIVFPSILRVVESLQKWTHGLRNQEGGGEGGVGVVEDSPA